MSFHPTRRHGRIWLWFVLAAPAFVAFIFAIMSAKGLFNGNSGTPPLEVLRIALILVLAMLRPPGGLVTFPVLTAMLVGLVALALTFSALPFWLRKKGLPLVLAVLVEAWSILLFLVALGEVPLVPTLTPEAATFGLLAALVPWPGLLLMLVVDAVLGSKQYRLPLCVFLPVGIASPLILLADAQLGAIRLQHALPAKDWPSFLIICLLYCLPLLVCLPFMRRLPAAKKRLRKQILARREAMPPEQRALGTTAACAQMVQLVRANVAPEAGYVAAYVALGVELGLDELTSTLAREGYRFAYPTVIGPPGHGRLEFFYTGSEPLTAADREIFATAFKHKTPEQLAHLQWVAPGQFSAVVLPGVGFAPDRFRMGYGGGFYDGYLARLDRRRTWAFGIGFDEQVCRSLPIEPHDQRLDAVVAPSTLSARPIVAL